MAQDTAPVPVESFELVGGRICLDFTNTVGNYLGVQRGEDRDKIVDYDDLLIFARRVGALDEAARQALVREATGRPKDAERVLGQARQLRRAIFDLLHPDAERAAREAALAVVDRAVAAARAREHLRAEGEGFVFALEADGAALDRPLWPIALSAAEVLTSPALARVRGCDHETCTWLFVDESKNQSRRWCTMRDCGNRVKAKRHYDKKRAG